LNGGMIREVVITLEMRYYKNYHSILFLSMLRERSKHLPEVVGTINGQHVLVRKRGCREAHTLEFTPLPPARVHLDLCQHSRCEIYSDPETQALRVPHWAMGEWERRTGQDPGKSEARLRSRSHHHHPATKMASNQYASGRKKIQA
jgi:hypothetical protein